jgi:hypothetical protein
MRRPAIMLAGLVALSGLSWAGGFGLAVGGGFGAGGGALGAAAGFSLSRACYLEGEYFSYPGGGSRPDSFALSDIGVSLLVYPGARDGRKTVPFIAVGPAVMLGRGQLDSVSFSFGGGVRSRLSSQLSLRFEARLFFRLYEIEDEYPAYDTTVVRVTAGLQFGK